MAEQYPNHVKNIIRIGTRDSLLALKQVEIAIQYIKSFYPNLDFKVIPIKTQGDKIKNIPLYEVGGKGLFTKEIDQYLLEEKVDLAIHSAKDIEAIYHQDLCFPIVFPRENPRDCFISFKYKSLVDIPYGGVVGTCSLRRKQQILLIRPDLKFVIMRGNINTRIEKLKNDQTIDAIILAYCGLKRVGMTEYVNDIFDFEQIIPSVCQGIIVGQSLKKNNFLNDILGKISHYSSKIQFILEREFIEELNGSCKTPVGCISYDLPDLEKIQAQFIIFNEEKKTYEKIISTDFKENALDIGMAAAQKLIKYL